MAKHYGLGRAEVALILESFGAFKEDKNLVKLTEVKWSKELLRRFNGEVRKRVLSYFDQLDSGESGVKAKWKRR